MPLTAYYRSTPAGNGKPRPPWFSKRLALRSFLRAVEQAGPGVTVVHVADGGVPDELADLVAVSGEVVPVRGGSAPRSFRRLLDVALARERGEGLAWFAEDDYLYDPCALAAVLAAADAVPQADYFGLYAPEDGDWYARSPSQPGRRGAPASYDVQGRRWRRAWDSTSTFGLRAQALREDAALLRLCSRCGGPWDNTCVAVVQGVAPYPLRHLHADLFLRLSRASAERVVTRPLLRAAADLAATRRRRTWIGPEVDLATHCELGHLSSGTDWAALANTMRAS